MQYYDRIEVFEGIDLNKTSASKQCVFATSDIFFQIKVLSFNCMSNGCHDVLMISINLNDIAILNIHRVNYCCNINGIDKSEAAKCCFN